MTPSRFLLTVAFSALSLIPVTAKAVTTTVNFGTVTSIDGPNDLFFTSGPVVYAVDMAPAGVNNVVNGVTFVRSGNIVGGVTAVPGFTTNFSQNPFAHSAAYGFTDGTPANNAALNAVYQDISCCSGTGAPHLYNLTVPNGYYKLMLLWSENSGSNVNNRSWDIAVEGALAIDQIAPRAVLTGQAVGSFPTGPTNLGLVYSHTLSVTDGVLNFSLGQIGGTAFPGGDANYVLSAFVVLQEVVPEPTTLVTGLLGAAGLLMRRRSARV